MCWVALRGWYPFFKFAHLKDTILPLKELPLFVMINFSLSRKFHVLTKKMPILSPDNFGVMSALMRTMRAENSLTGNVVKSFSVPAQAERRP